MSDNNLKMIELFRCEVSEDGTIMRIVGNGEEVNELRERVPDDRPVVCTMDGPIKDFCLALFGAFAATELRGVMEELQEEVQLEKLKQMDVGSDKAN